MAESPKQRLLVMNGQRLLQTAQASGWATSKVDKAGALKPGIYDLHLSKSADRARSYEGTMLFADTGSVYQQVGKDLIRHKRADFANVPEPGATIHIQYEGDRAVVATSTAKLVRGRGR